MFLVFTLEYGERLSVLRWLGDEERVVDKEERMGVSTRLGINVTACRRGRVLRAGVDH